MPDFVSECSNVVLLQGLSESCLFVLLHLRIGFSDFVKNFLPNRSNVEFWDSLPLTKKNRLPVVTTTYRDRRLACYMRFVLVIIYDCRSRGSTKRMFP